MKIEPTTSEEPTSEEIDPLAGDFHEDCQACGAWLDEDLALYPQCSRTEEEAAAEHRRVYGY